MMKRLVITADMVRTSGMLRAVLFDPKRQHVRLYELPSMIAEEASVMYVDGEVDGQGRSCYLDSSVSMSGLAVAGARHAPTVDEYSIPGGDAVLQCSSPAAIEVF